MDVSKKDEEKQALSKLESLERILSERGIHYQWTRDELIHLAPEFKGSPTKFSLRQYIENFKERHPALRRRQILLQASTSKQTPPQVDKRQLPSIQSAVMELFHATCPHPIRYRTEDGIDVVEYKADLILWMTDITATWIHLPDTEHQEDCKCCLTFRRMATNYEEMLKTMMTPAEFDGKRVSINDIRRWAADIEGESAKESLAKLRHVAASYLRNEETCMLSELTDDSSNISDACEPPSIISTKPSLDVIEDGEIMRLDDSESEEEAISVPLRRRKIVPRPLDTVIEISDVSGIVSFALPEIGYVAKVPIPDIKGYSRNRSAICKHGRIYLRQMIRARNTVQTLDALSNSKAQRQIDKMYRGYRKSKQALSTLLDRTQAIFTTRSRKRAREKMLDV